MEVPVDVLCLGESMALFVPTEAGPPERVRMWTRTVGGAESNVACHLAGMGVAAAWVSAVGDDAFGRAVADFVAGFGVDVSRVRVDPSRPTGLYVKESDAGGSPVRYYRRGSAASAMGPELVAELPLDQVRIVHTSGITPALSDSCLALVRELVAAPRRTHLLSFDLNWRPALWRDRDPAVLRELAAAADIVLVGADEALAVWDADGPAAIRELLPEPGTLVVKQAEQGATLVERDPDTGRDRPPVVQPALRVDVVEPVGAGDAFAAGFLAATLAGAPPRRRLRAGHLQAAAVLRTTEDVCPPLPADLVTRLTEADDDEWAAAHLR
ncbi:sugar kinase [Actinophytocola xanthii]|uniref:sugar kinase n=1 Tax=Actinophytocola xanthii TaxID=1912961 RepID=UPI0022B87D8B|nr:sugar kinase [Actinophytocola xanthii]